MIWAVTFGTFLATVTVCVSLYYAFTSGESGIVRRLSRLTGTPETEQREKFAEKQKERVQEVLVSVGKLVPGGTASRAQLMILRAGYRSQNAVLTVRGLKVLLPIALIGAAYFSGFYLSNPFVILGGALLAGILLPEIWILWRVSVRQHHLRRGLPDALDLLVICVEAGLGLPCESWRVAPDSMTLKL